MRNTSLPEFDKDSFHRGKPYIVYNVIVLAFHIYMVNKMLLLARNGAEMKIKSSLYQFAEGYDLYWCATEATGKH